MPLTKQGRIELLNSIIQNEYWIGLFSNSESALSGDLLNFGVSSTLEDISGFEFTNKIEYRRKKIESSDWIVDENNFNALVYKTFDTKLEDWKNIQGYFVCTKETGIEGDVIYICEYLNYRTIWKNTSQLEINLNIFI